jgi:hypothetical protein
VYAALPPVPLAALPRDGDAVGIAVGVAEDEE